MKYIITAKDIWKHKNSKNVWYTPVRERALNFVSDLLDNPDWKEVIMETVSDVEMV